MARKVNRNLAVAATAAIAAVYAVGYAATQSHTTPAAGSTAGAAPQPSASAANTAPVQPASVSAPPAIDTPTQIARAIAAATAPPTATAAAAGYRDGTYTGTGTSRRGNVTVQLTIANGQITDVKITHSTTYYPISDISRLPGEVVSRQSANVDFVSGATESSRAFRGAVSQALAQAGGSGLAPAGLQTTAGAA